MQSVKSPLSPSVSKQKKIPAKIFPRNNAFVHTLPDYFMKIESVSLYNPEVLVPLPKAEYLRTHSEWWVRCASGKMIDFVSCYESFLNINALYRKDHACHMCPLGKTYREMHSEGVFGNSRFDSFIQ